MKRYTLTGLLALGLAVPAAFAADLPAVTPAAKLGPAWGAAEVQPTPEHPVYFRWCQGYFPGATPPLEWWEGTPVIKTVPGVFGNPPQRGEAAMLDFADQKSKNILWKVPVPGYSLTHPIVVGKKVFAVGEPDFVTCWDLDTGKQLWQRRIMPLLCDGLSEEKAVAGQKVLDLARAIWLVTGVPSTPGFPSEHDGNFYYDGTYYGIIDKMDMTEGTVAKRTAFAEKFLRMAQKYRPDVEAFGDADLLKALDEDIAIIQSWAKAQRDVNALSALVKDPQARSSRLVTACLKKFGVQIGGSWWGYIGTADSNLASDGQRIYGVFDQGQVFALDLDGKIVWQHREKGSYDNRGTFHRSPLLCGDLLLVRSRTYVFKGSNRPLRAFDVKTGQLRWEAPLAGSNYAVPQLMRLPGADGKPVDVLIGDALEGKEGLAVLRVRDGKRLGCLPPHAPGRGALLFVQGQQVTWYSTDDQGGGPNCSFRLKLDGADSVVAEKVFVLDKKDRVFGGGDFPAVAGNHLVQISSDGISLVDTTGPFTTGSAPSMIGKLPMSNKGNCLGVGVIAGHHLIAMTGGYNEPNKGRGGPGSRGRDDHMITCEFTVVDIKDPAKPVVVANNNLLGYTDPPADFIVSTYFKEFDPFIFVGCYKGSVSYFMLMSGPVPVGNKLLIQSSAFLYCVGPEVQDAPGDNPATVQAIRVAKPAELKTYLTSPSAQYRHTAVTAMITAGIGDAKDVLTKLVGEDTYEEIRAAAILALNAAEPDAAPGTQALLPLMTAPRAAAVQRQPPSFERRAIQRTLEALGKERGTALLAAAFMKTQDELTRQSLVDFAAVMGWATPELTRQAQAYLALNGPNLLGVRYLVGSRLIQSDKEVLEAVKRALPHLDGDQLTMLAPPLDQVLEVEEKVAFLVLCLSRSRLGENHHVYRDYRAPFLRQLREMGRGAASALPELEKMVAAHANLADEFAPVIAAIKGK